MRSRRKSEPIDPRPVMPRGETEFEEARMKTDFLAVFKRVSEMGLSSLSDTYEYTYRAGRVAGKADARRMVQE